MLQIQYILPLTAASAVAINQFWGTCGPREYLIWPPSELSLPKLRVQHRVKTKLHDKQVLRQSREVTLPHG